MNIAYPQAPMDAVMPAAVQEMVLWGSSIILLVVLVVAILQARRYQTFLPVLFLVAGACNIILEPLVTHLGHAVHPEIGQISAFKTADRAIPWHAVIMYSFYFGAVYMLMYGRIVNQSFTANYVWRSYFITCVFAYVFEILPVNTGLWGYYDQQALWVWRGSQPLFWTFVNCTSIYVSLTLIKLFHPLLKGGKQLLVLVLTPIGAVAAHFGAGSPFYNLTNSSAGPLLINISGLMSIGAALVIIFLCARLLSADTDAMMLGTKRHGVRRP